MQAGEHAGEALIQRMESLPPEGAVRALSVVAEISLDQEIEAISAGLWARNPETVRAVTVWAVEAWVKNDPAQDPGAGAWPGDVGPFSEPELLPSMSYRIRLERVLRETDATHAHLLEYLETAVTSGQPERVPGLSLAMSVLGSARYQAAEDVFISLTRSEALGVRIHAMHGLVAVVGKSACPYLVPLLGSEELAEVDFALTHIADLKCANAAEAIFPLLESESEQVRRSARLTLAALARD